MVPAQPVRWPGDHPLELAAAAAQPGLRTSTADVYPSRTLAMQKGFERTSAALQRGNGFCVAQAGAKQELAWTFLHQLKVEQARFAFEDRAQCKRQKGDDPPGGASELDGVIAAALDVDDREMRTARTGFGVQRHAVSQVIPDQRLQMIGEVGEQDRGTRGAARDGVPLVVDGFQDRPVAVQVQVAQRAFEGQ
jgi:hypothetical protein